MAGEASERPPRSAGMNGLKAAIRGMDQPGSVLEGVVGVGRKEATEADVVFDSVANGVDAMRDTRTSRPRTVQESLSAAVKERGKQIDIRDGINGVNTARLEALAAEERAAAAKAALSAMTVEEQIAFAQAVDDLESARILAVPAVGVDEYDFAAFSTDADGAFEGDV